MLHFSCRDDVLTYLIHLGYLGYDQTSKKAFVPNEDVRQEFGKAVSRVYSGLLWQYPSGGNL